jgi:hypothetical protein
MSKLQLVDILPSSLYLSMGYKNSDEQSGESNKIFPIYAHARLPIFQAIPYNFLFLYHPKLHF